MTIVLLNNVCSELQHLRIFLSPHFVDFEERGFIDRMNAPGLLERDHSSLLLAWRGHAGADAYELEMSADDADWISLSNSLKGTSIRKKNLLGGVSYRFRIRFKSANGDWSDFSPSSDEFRVLGPDVSLMDAPEVSGRDDVSATLQWKEVPGAESYFLRLRSDEEGSPEANRWTHLENAIKSTTVRKKGLKPGANYYFAVLPVFPEGDDTHGSWTFSTSSAPVKVLSMSPFMQKLFPAQLISANGTLVQASSVLTGKCVAIYFSAHWCGPCRQFTPKLLELYAQCKAANKRFEIVFCSADHSEAEFRQYHGTMTWPAIGYDEEHREGLMGMFKVSGIPRLVVLAASGKIVVDNAITGAPLTTAVVDQWVQMSDNMK